MLDPGKLAASGLTVPDVAASLRSQNQLAAGGAVRRGRAAVPVARLGAVDVGRSDLAAPVLVRDGTTCGSATWARCFRARRIARCSSPATAGTRCRSASRSRLARTSSTVERGVNDALADLGKALPAGLTITKVYDLAEFVRAAIANVRDAILIGGLLAVDRAAGLPAGLRGSPRLPRSHFRSRSFPHSSS